MKRRDKWYLRFWKYDPKKGEYGPEWQPVGEDRGHALARLNACKITDEVPQVELYRIKETKDGVLIESEKVAVKDSADGYNFVGVPV